MGTFTVRATIDTILAMLLVVFTGCTHTRSLTAYPHADQAWVERVNRELQNHRVTMVLRDGRRVDAKNVQIVGDTVSWRAGTQQAQASQIVDVREFSFRSHLRGALDGLIIGVAIGAPSGALIIDPPKGESGQRVQAALAGSLSMGLWTAGLGAVRGSRIVYRVESTPESTPSVSNQHRCTNIVQLTDRTGDAGLDTFRDNGRSLKVRIALLPTSQADGAGGAANHAVCPRTD
jgi:hypothetical protein